MLVAVFACGASADSPRRHRSTTTPRPQRLLVLSLPATTWTDIDPATTPHLAQLLDHSGVADLNTRSASGLSKLGVGYATLGAGTRSATDGVTDGDAFGANELFGDGTASDVFRLRTGRTVQRGLVHLGLAGLVAKNAGLLFDAKIGALGDALAKAGFGRAVIANADGVEPYTPPLPQYRRDAVTGLMGSDGTVPAGAVGPALLQPDQAAPFGRDSPPMPWSGSSEPSGSRDRSSSSRGQTSSAPMPTRCSPHPRSGAVSGSRHLRGPTRWSGACSPAWTRVVMPLSSSDPRTRQAPTP